jgi:hypothetical protein
VLEPPEARIHSEDSDGGYSPRSVATWSELRWSKSKTTGGRPRGEKRPGEGGPWTKGTKGTLPTTKVRYFAIGILCFYFPRHKISTHASLLRVMYIGPILLFSLCSIDFLNEWSFFCFWGFPGLDVGPICSRPRRCVSRTGFLRPVFRPWTLEIG